MSPSSLIGKTAPAFTLKNHDDTDYEFKAETGTPTAIFFYPKSGKMSEELFLCDKPTSPQGRLDAPGRPVSSETHSSASAHSLSSFEPGRSLPDFADNDAFKGSNLRVIGISPDSVKEQDTFVKNQKLTVSSPNERRPTVGSDLGDSQYPVLSDSSGEFRKLYGVGKGILGLVDARVTYFVDSDGIVR